MAKRKQDEDIEKQRTEAHGIKAKAHTQTISTANYYTLTRTSIALNYTRISAEWHLLHRYFYSLLLVAAEMTRADRVTVLLQERQDKDIRKINEVH